MSSHRASPAHVVLEAVRFATDADINALRRLVADQPDVLRLDLVLRILLTYLPESTEPSIYTGFLQDLVSQNLNSLDDSPSQQSSLQEISKDEAQRRVRKLRLLRLSDLADPSSGDQDVFTTFLLNRAYRIDEETGSLPLLQQLLEPFLNHSHNLQVWLISTLLPLLRLCYEYHPQLAPAYSLKAFERLQGRSALNALLPEADYESGGKLEAALGRDLRGLVGPWMYGCTKGKRRKLDHGRKRSISKGVTPSTHLEAKVEEDLSTDWSYVNDWLLDLSLRDLSQAVNAIEQWDGPKDVDYGGWNNHEDGKDVHQNEIREAMNSYAQAGMAIIYATHDATAQTYRGAQTVLGRVAQLTGLPNTPKFPAYSSTFPSSTIPSDYIASITSTDLFHEVLLRKANPLTTPSEHSVQLASFLLLSMFMLDAFGYPQTFKTILQLTLFGTASDQRDALRRVLHSVQGKKDKDDRAWHSIRYQMRWLSDWGWDGKDNRKASPTARQGLFGKLEQKEVEMEILKALLADSCYRLVIDIYCEPHFEVVPKDEVEKTILEIALMSYDNASNGNRTRGGVKKASDLMQTFRRYFQLSKSFKELDSLILATHALSFYSLTLQHGVPFQPVNIRIRSDPLALIEKVLRQNPRSYTKLDDLVNIGRNLVEAGLVQSRAESYHQPDPLDRQIILVEKRIIARSIEAALAEDDFDTAYSYVVTRFSPTQQWVVDTSGGSNPSITAEDDITWQAAYQAGRFRTRTLDGPLELRRLEQKMELLSQALLLAPPAFVQEVLATWRNCEDEMNETLAHESEEEERWNEKGDRKLPGGFDAEDTDKNTKPREPTRAAMNEEAPMGLFDVARGAAAAISKSAFPLRSHGEAPAKSPIKTAPQRPESIIGSDSGGEGGGSGNGADSDGRVRKRDMVSNMVTGGLASGIGWVLGAPPARPD